MDSCCVRVMSESSRGSQHLYVAMGKTIGHSAIVTGVTPRVLMLPPDGSLQHLQARATQRRRGDLLLWRSHVGRIDSELMATRSN